MKQLLLALSVAATSLLIGCQATSGPGAGSAAGPPASSGERLMSAEGRSVQGLGCVPHSFTTAFLGVRAMATKTEETTTVSEAERSLSFACRVDCDATSLVSIVKVSGDLVVPRRPSDRRATQAAMVISRKTGRVIYATWR